MSVPADGPTSQDHLPHISVITPALNNAHTIEATLNSVLDQQYPHLEYLVVDGGSTDGTLDILSRYSQRLHCRSEPDAGIADAFNKGVARATGQLVGIINADDQYTPDALHAVANAHHQRLAAGQPPAILHGDLYWCEAATAKPGATVSERRIKPRLWGGRDGVGWAFHFDMPVLHPTCFVPRAVYETVGPFDTAYRMAMDFDWLLRAFRRGVPFEYVPQPLARFHTGGISTRDTRPVLAEVLRSQRSHGLALTPCTLSYLAKRMVAGIRQR